MSVDSHGFAWGWSDYPVGGTAKTSSMSRRYNLTNEDDLKKAVKMPQDYVKKLLAKRQKRGPVFKGCGMQAKKRA